MSYESLDPHILRLRRMITAYKNILSLIDDENFHYPDTHLTDAKYHLAESIAELINHDNILEKEGVRIPYITADFFSILTDIDPEISQSVVLENLANRYLSSPQKTNTSDNTTPADTISPTIDSLRSRMANFMHTSDINDRNSIMLADVINDIIFVLEQMGRLE